MPGNTLNADAATGFAFRTRNPSLLTTDFLVPSLVSLNLGQPLWVRRLPPSRSREAAPSVPVAVRLCPIYLGYSLKTPRQGRSGWWLMITLVPVVGAIILLLSFVREGDRGANRYGPDPKS
jgi:hypothetical protein